MSSDRPSSDPKGAVQVQTPVRTTALAVRGVRSPEQPTGAATTSGPSSLVSATPAIYALTREIDKGGMGLVYQARDERLNRPVAIKLSLRSQEEDAGAVQRFVEEAQITSQLEHPNIVPVHELGVDQENRVYFTMKLVKGETLAQRLKIWRTQPLSPALLFQALTILLKVLDALAFAHSKGVVHRDVKPANIMIGEYGEVLLMDWGIARVLDKQASGPRHRATAKPASAGGLALDSTSLTVDGDIVGTPGYMAPEQANGILAAITPRTDLYAVGVLLYEILAGKSPYAGNPTELIARTVTGKLKAPHERAPERAIPPELEAVALRAMARDPRARYPSARALAQDLEAFLAGRSVSARPDTRLAALRKFIHRHQALVGTIAAAALIVVLVSVTAFLHVLAQRDIAQHALAETEAANAARDQAEHDRAATIASDAERSHRRIQAMAPYTTAMDLLSRPGFAADAVRVLRQATTLDPSFAEAEFALGQALVAAGEPGEAVEHFLHCDELARADGGHGNPRALLAAAFAKDETGQISADTFNRLASEGSDNVFTCIGRCFEDVAQARGQDLLAQVQQLEHQDARLWEVHYGLGYAIERASEMGLVPHEQIERRAVPELRRACELSPYATQPRAWLVLALLRSGTGAPGEVDALISEMRRMQPHNALIELVAADIDFERGRMARARAELARAEAMGPPAVPAENLRAQLCGVDHDVTGALRHLREAYRLDPMPPMLRSLIITLLETGASDAMDLVPTARQQLAGTPDWCLIQVYLAREHQDFPAMCAAVEEGLRLAPYHAPLLSMRAACRVLQHRPAREVHEAAVACLQQTCASSRATVALGAAAAALSGDRTLAQEAIRRFNDTFPDLPPITTAELDQFAVAWHVRPPGAAPAPPAPSAHRSAAPAAPGRAPTAPPPASGLHESSSGTPRLYSPEP